MVVKIIPDTNLIQGGGAFFFENNLWPVILAAIRNGLAELLVPEVVVRELTTHYSEEVKRAQQDLRKVHRSLGRLRVDVDAGQLQQALEEITSDYEQWLRSHVTLHGRILPLPTVSHDRLLTDTLKGRKPLSRGDGGYRDALIWHSLLEVARESSGEIILLSENTKDFASTTGELSPDLQADLSTLQSQVTVRLVSKLQGLVDLIVPEDPKATEEVATFFGSKPGMNALDEALEEHFETYRRERFTGRARALPSWLLYPDIEAFPRITTRQVLAAYKLGGDAGVVTAELQGFAYVGGYTHPASLSHLDAEGFEVWDHLGSEQVYVAYSHPQHIKAIVSFKWSISGGITDMTFIQVDLMTDHLTPAPEYQSASQCPADPEGACRWLRFELDHLLLLDPLQFSSATRSAPFMSAIHSALEAINSSSAVRALSPVESMPIAPDNLGSMLTDRQGVQFLLKTLGTLKFGQE